MDVAAWVRGWSAEYADRDGEDRMLLEFRDADHFTRRQVERLVDWKFQGDARRRRRTRDLLATEDDERIEQLTRQAFACFHDYVALLACHALSGVGPATASVLLMARSPERYTVIDNRALASLRGLGRLPAGSHFAVADDWEPYLDACRRLAADTAVDLRTVDRALVVANGRAEPRAGYGPTPP